MAKFKGLRPGYVGRIDSSVPVVEADEKVPPQVQQAFEGAMNGLIPRLPTSVSELRDALGGTNKAARALGVTPRSIQRYIAAEEHRTSQARRAEIGRRGEIVAKLQNAVAPKLRGDLERNLRERGAMMRALGTLRIGMYHEGRFISVRLPGEAWKTILSHWNKGDAKGAAAAFQSWFGRAYGRSGNTKGHKKHREDFSWGYLQELTFEPPH